MVTHELQAAGDDERNGQDEAALRELSGQWQVFKSALEKQQVSFYHVSTAWERSLEPNGQRYADILPQLIESFGERKDGVVSLRYYPSIHALTVLTAVDAAAERRGRAIHYEVLSGSFKSIRAQELLASCLDLHARALEHLTERPRRVCVGQLFLIVTSILGELDAHAGREVGDDVWESLQKQVDSAEEYYRASAQRAAQITYFRGTLVGALPAVIALPIVVAFKNVEIFSTDVEHLAASLIAGSLGATVSVMTRATTGNLELQGLEEVDPRTIRVFGTVRPLIGALFGFILFGVIAGGIIDLVVPKDPAGLFMFAILGFAAGFSERFARDALTAVEGSLPARGAPPVRPARS